MDRLPSAEFLALQAAVSGRYSLERELGRGGMGVVYLARDVRLDRPVAIKLLPPALAVQAPLRERFLREARTAAGLSHPNIVPIHLVEEQGDVVFFVMAYVDGETLSRRVLRTGPLPPEDATRVIREVAWALAYAHSRGVVHRDVKPDNILVERGTGRALVTDFGIARVADAQHPLTAADVVLGTPHFMSPEQAAGEPIDGRSDLYSLGIVAFYALTGQLPFDAPTAQAVLGMQLTQEPPPLALVRPGLPRRLVDAVDRCLAKEPDARFSSGEALGDALGTLGEARADTAPPIRSFLRTAETTAALAVGVVFMIMLMGFRIGGLRLGAIAATVGFALTVGIDLVRRARTVVRHGFTHADVVAGLQTEQVERDREAAAIHGPKALGSSSRAVARDLAGIGAGGALLGAAVGVLNVKSHPPLAVALLSLMAVAGFALILVVLVRSPMISAHSDRYGARLARMVWGGRIGQSLFRLATLTPVDAVGPAVGARRPEDLLEHAIVGLLDTLPGDSRARLRSVSAQVATLAERARALRRREEELDRTLAEAGGERAAQEQAREPAEDGDGSRAPETPHAMHAALATRRLELVENLRIAQREARERRATLLAALENVRLQLLRLRAGVGTEGDALAEVETAAAAAEPERRLAG